MTLMTTPEPDASSTAVDRRMPTMKDVAVSAGVSRQLVSMVMRGVAGPSEASRERVLAAAAALGFHTNMSARLLRQSRTKLIGLGFVATSAFQARFAERFVERAREEQFGAVLAPITTTRRTDEVITEMIGFRVEALAFFNPDPTSTALHHALDTLPVVWLGERRADERAESVHSDDDAGLRLAVDHLVTLGHRDIAYVGGLNSDGSAGPERARAYRSAMVGAGLTDRIDVLDATFDAEDAANAARALLNRDRLPTAIIACSDTSAVAVMTVLRNAGVSVPGEVSIIGYDDSAVAALSFHALTSVTQDVDLSVDATLAAIIGRLEDPSRSPSNTLITASLVTRHTTAPPREQR
jgi:DNA-binding LacI/PurR family transcriptional regulator